MANEREGAMYPESTTTRTAGEPITIRMPPPEPFPPDLCGILIMIATPKWQCRNPKPCAEHAAKEPTAKERMHAALEERCSALVAMERGMRGDPPYPSHLYPDYERACQAFADAERDFVAELRIQSTNGEEGK